MLVDRHRIPLGGPSDPLKLCISQPAVPGEVGDRLVAEGVGHCPYPRFFGVQPHDLLHPPGAAPDVPAGLEQPSVVGMGGDVGPQGSGQASPEEHVAVLAAPPLLERILQASRSKAPTAIRQSSSTREPVYKSIRSIRLRASRPIGSRAAARGFRGGENPTPPRISSGSMVRAINSRSRTAPPTTNGDAAAGTSRRPTGERDDRERS